MKLIACMIWYDESPTWLAATVASLTRIGVDELVVLDGSWPLYPDATPRSSYAEAEALTLAADAANIGLTLARPREQWWGGEVAKRTAAFRIAEAVGTRGEDWVLVIDADEVIVDGDPTLKDELAATGADAATIHLVQWWGDPHADAETERLRQLVPHPSRYGQLQSRLFRLCEDMRVVGSHYSYTGTCRDRVSRNLRADYPTGHLPELEVAELMTPQNLPVIEHRDPQRSAGRRDAKKAYYEARDELGIERDLGAREPLPPATLHAILPPELAGEV